MTDTDNLDRRMIDQPLWKLVHNINVSQDASAELQPIMQEIRQRVIEEMRVRPEMARYSVAYHTQKRAMDNPDVAALIETDILARQRAMMYGLAAVTQQLQKLQAGQKETNRLLRKLVGEPEQPEGVSAPTRPR